MATLANLVVKVTADAKEFTTGINQARSGTNAFTRDARHLTVVNGGLSRSFRTSGAAASRAAVDFNKLRGPLASVANGVLKLPPGLASVASILGSFALSGGVLAGAIVGLAALGLAWKKLKGDADEAREALKSAADQALRIRAAESHVDIETTKNINALSGGIFKQRNKVSRLEMLGYERSNPAKLREERARLQSMIGQRDTLRGSLLKNLPELDAIEAVATSAKTHARETERAAEAWKKVRAEVAALPWSPLAGTGRMGAHKSIGGTSTMFERPPEPGPRMSFGDRALGFASATGLSFKDAISSRMKQLTDPSALGGMLAGGAMSLAASAVGKLVGTISRLGGTSEAAARQIAAAQQRMVQSLRDSVINLTGSTSDKALVDVRKTIADQVAALVAGGLVNFPIGTTGSARERAARSGVARDAFLAQLGNVGSFDALIKMVEGMKPLFGTTNQGLDAYNDLLKLVTALTDNAKKEIEGLGNAAKAASEALRNVPQGFKIALARFNATEGLATSGGGDDGGGGEDEGGRPPKRGEVGFNRGAVTVNGDVYVVANDPDQFSRQMARRQFRKTGSIGGPLQVA